MTWRVSRRRPLMSQQLGGGGCPSAVWFWLVVKTRPSGFPSPADMWADADEINELMGRSYGYARHGRWSRTAVSSLGTFRAGGDAVCGLVTLCVFDGVDVPALLVTSVPEVSDGELETELAGLQDAWAEEDAAGVFLPGTQLCELVCERRVL